MNIRQLFFDWQYRFSQPPWDSGVTPPQVVAFVERTTARGRALDLGCGTGTNALYLAQHGFTVVGVDFSARAIATARARVQRAGFTPTFHVADVSRLEFLTAPFAFVLDIGCFHAIEPTARARYVAGIARLTQPGSQFMLYAFAPRPPEQRPHWLALRNVGVTPAEVTQLFAPAFELTRVEHGTDRARASAWYWFTRK